MRKVLLIIIVIALAALLYYYVYSDNGGKSAALAKIPSYTEDSLIEIGQKQWDRDYYGDNLRKPTHDELLLAAKRANACANLEEILAEEKVFLENNGDYTEDFTKLNLGPATDGIYTYSLSVPVPSRLRITATANFDNDKYQDILEMNQLGDVKIIEDDIRDWGKTAGVWTPAKHIQKARSTERILQESADRRLEDIE